MQKNKTIGRICVTTTAPKTLSGFYKDLKLRNFWGVCTYAHSYHFKKLNYSGICIKTTRSSVLIKQK